MPFNANTPARRVLPHDYGAYQETNPSIPIGSTLSVLGSLLLVISTRFRYDPDSSIPYYFTPTTAGETVKYDPKKTSLIIKKDLEHDTQNKDMRPAIIVGRGMLATQKSIIDNQVSEQRNTGKRLHHSLVSAPFTMRCRDYTPGGSEAIANIVLEWLLYNRDPIRQHFQYHDIGPFTMSPTVPVSGSPQTDVYETSVETRITWEHRWSTQPIAPNLKSLILTMYNDLAEDEGGDLSQIIKVLSRS